MNYSGDTASAFCIYRNILSREKRERIFFSLPQRKVKTLQLWNVLTLKRHNFETL